MTVICDSLSKSYGETRVLDGFSHTFSPGEPTAVTGPSGAGKTTLLRLILGLEAPDAGAVRFSGGPREPRFGVLFQEDRLFEGLDAETNIRLATGLRDREGIRRGLLRLLPEEALGRPVSRLSGGQRRRVSLARALLVPADVLVLDEPFTGLDAEAARLAADAIREAAGDRPLLMALHEKDVPAWCRTVLVG